MKENEKAMMMRNENDEPMDLDFFRPFSDAFEDGMMPMMRMDRNLMKTDVKDEGNDYRFAIEVPGVDKKDIHLTVKNGYLTVSANMNKSMDDRKGKTVLSERFNGSYRRSFFVGEGVNTKNVTASEANGVLTVIVPKVNAKETSDEVTIQ